MRRFAVPIALPPQRGGGRLARGERSLRTPGKTRSFSNPPRQGLEDSTLGLRQGFGISCNPSGVRVVVRISTQGFAKSAHPWLISAGPAGAEEESRAYKEQDACKVQDSSPLWPWASEGKRRQVAALQKSCDCSYLHLTKTEPEATRTS